MIMKMQQATNSQVGLPGNVRDEWFQQLKDIAQLFIQAQVAATKIEQLSNTEKVQLQGSLSSALTERDLAVAQKQSAQQEVEILRGRLQEKSDQADQADAKGKKAETSGYGNNYQASIQPKCLQLHYFFQPLPSPLLHGDLR